MISSELWNYIIPLSSELPILFEIHNSAIMDLSRYTTTLFGHECLSLGPVSTGITGVILLYWDNRTIGNNRTIAFTTARWVPEQ